MSVLSTSPEVRQVPHLRLIRDEDDVPYDTGASPREWRPMMPPDLYSPDIGPDGIAVYGVLCLHVDGKTGDCWPAQDTIAKRIGISRQRVNRAIQCLERYGFVAVSHRDDRGMKRSNLYHLPHQITANGQMYQNGTTLYQNGTADVPKQDSGCTDTVHKPYVSEPDVNEPKGDTPLPPKQAEYPAEFETFWTHYPSGHGNKKKTAEAWKKITPDAETRAQIMAGLEKWNACDRWRRGYVKDAVVWLRDHWWLDEPPPPDQAPPTNGTYRNGKDIGLSTAELLGIATEPDEPANVFETFGRVK